VTRLSLSIDFPEYEFLDWALEDGQSQAKALEYVPLPGDVIKQIEAEWPKELVNAWKLAATH
jgi:hypothetical protein